MTDTRADLVYPNVMNFVLGGLATHCINNLFRGLVDHEGDEWDLEDTCCPQCCAPCVSLKWLYENARTATSHAVSEAVGTGWDWQTEDGMIDWPQILAYWERSDELGCHE